MEETKKEFPFVFRLDRWDFDLLKYSREGMIDIICPICGGWPEFGNSLHTSGHVHFICWECRKDFQVFMAPNKNEIIDQLPLRAMERMVGNASPSGKFVYRLCDYQNKLVIWGNDIDWWREREQKRKQEQDDIFIRDNLIK